MNSMINMSKSLARSFLRRNGYEISRQPRPLIDNRNSRLKISMDLLVPHLTRTSKRPTFVQIGANDGVQADPIHDFIRTCNWTGLLVEPQPKQFEKLRQNYSHFPGLLFENVALAGNDGVRKLYCLDPNTQNVPADAFGLASFDRLHLIKHQGHVPGIEGMIREVEVPCVTFRTLLTRNALHSVDIVQIDCEGFDAEVVKMIPFDMISPRLVRFEHQHLTTSQHGEALTLLIEKGFKIWVEDLDTIAYKL